MGKLGDWVAVRDGVLDLQDFSMVPSDRPALIQGVALQLDSWREKN